MTWEDNYLAHYGVQGMRWGVRKYVDENGKLTAEGRAHYNIGEFRKKILANGEKGISKLLAKLPLSKAKRESNKKVSEMSDQELRERINRMQMEKQYEQMKAEAKGGKPKDNRDFSQKHPILRQILMQPAMNVATSLVTDKLQTKADELFSRKRMERAEKSGMMNPELQPFQLFLSERNKRYNNSEKLKKINEEKVQERIKAAVSEAVKTDKEREQRNLESAVKAAVKDNSEAHQRNLNQAARTAKAEENRKATSAASQIFSELNSARMSANEKKAARKAVQDYLKKLMNS